MSNTPKSKAPLVIGIVLTVVVVVVVIAVVAWKVTSDKKAATDATTAPSGTTAPGTTAPGTTAPGTTAPGTTAPGTTAPGTTAPGTTAPSSLSPCPATASGWAIGTTNTCLCAPNQTISQVWGTDTYTDDSRICVAAIHAGKTVNSGGGAVTVNKIGGQSSYTPSTRNGVTSSSWGQWTGSYQFI